MTALFDPAVDRVDLFAALSSQLRHVGQRSAFYRRLWEAHGVDGSTLAGLGDLERLPFTTKAMLRESQAAVPPLGEHGAVPMTDVVRLHASTGTTGTPSWVGVTAADARAWTGLVSAALRRQGLTRDDVVVHGAGLALFVGGLPVQDAVEHIGATMVPVGTGASAKALLAMQTLGVTVLHSTPSYARYLAEYVRERTGLSPARLGLRKVMVGGEPGGGEPAFRRRLAEEWGAVVTEGLGNADMAPIIFAEAPGTPGMRLTASADVHVELVDPDTGEAVTPDKDAQGELVYTSLRRECCPLVRFRTGDRIVVTGHDPDGAPLIRCVGRTDDMLIVLGVNVFPSAVRDVVSEFAPRTSGFVQVVLDGPGPRVEPPLRVHVELGAHPGDLDELRQQLEKTIRQRLSVRSSVELVAFGQLERAEMKAQLTRVEPVGVGN